MRIVLAVLFLIAFFATPLRAESTPGTPGTASTTSATSAASAADTAPEVDFDNEDTFVDLADALKSKHYVRRAILSTAIRTTSKMTNDRWYINQLLGVDAVFIRENGSKYDSGMLALAIGYLAGANHGFELGVELSSVSNLTLGYRYVLQFNKILFRPYLGAGLGMDVGALSIVQLPAGIPEYTGPKQMVFASAGVLIPLVEVGLKVEFRMAAYGMARLMATSGIGAVFFL
jgi:hypothetical protein